MPNTIRSIGLVVNTEREGAIAFATKLAGWLQERGLRVCASRNLPEVAEERDEEFDCLVGESDLVVVLGGDGSLLGASRRAGPAGKPILGIHWGGMGFLNECGPDDAQSAIERVLDGDYHVEERLMLLAELRRGEELVYRGPALNDVAITRDTLSRILTVEVTIGDDLAATYQGDGMLIATPTGSTGHSLSAGGPVLDPRVEALCITPICPHSLSGRSIVVPASESLRVRHFSPLASVVITLDGQIGMPMLETDVVSVRRAPWPARLVRFGQIQFYKSLRDKLHWRL